jgi:hypothetical protein
LICCPWANSCSFKQLYPYYLVQILGFWVTCGVKMMSLHHGWGGQPMQTASHIHIRHVQSVWAHWYAVHGHEVAALNSYPAYLLRFWSSRSLVESEWCHYTATWTTASHMYIRHIQIVWAHWYAVNGHMAVASKSYTQLTLVIFWDSGSLVESKWCHYVMVEADSHLSHCFPHPH